MFYLTYKPMISRVRSQAPKGWPWVLSPAVRIFVFALFSAAKVWITRDTRKHKSFIVGNISFHETIVAHNARFVHLGASSFALTLGARPDGSSPMERPCVRRGHAMGGLWRWLA